MIETAPVFRHEVNDAIFMFRQLQLSFKLLALLTGLCCLSLRAEQYRYDYWTSDIGGLPQNIIRGIVQTPDGYLWIATLDGVARFDGVRFTVFNKSNVPGIASNRIVAMLPGEKGDLWLITESGSITRYHGGAFHTYGVEEGIPANSLHALTGDAAGHIWFLSDNSIMEWDSQRSALRDITPDNLRTHYRPLWWDSAGFWGSDASDLHIFCHGRFLKYRLPAWVVNKPIWNVGVDQNENVWIEEPDGRQSIIFAQSGIAEHLDHAHPRPFVYRDVHGHAWTFHVGVRLSRALDFESSGKPASIPLNSFLEDREGNVWIGTEGSGLYRLQAQSVTVYGKDHGLADTKIYPMLEDRAGNIWVGDWDSGLSRFSYGRFANYTMAQGLPGRLVSALAEDHAGNLWVGTHGGLSIYRDGHFVSPAGIVLPDQVTPQAILQDRGGCLWIGTMNGLVLYRDGPSKTLTVEDGLATNDVRVILESASGDIWVGGYGGVTRIHGAQFTRWTERDGLPSGNVRAMYEDKDGVLWIGTYDGGLGRFKDGKFTTYSERNGLFNNGVFQILEDDRGNLWIGCNRGIYRVSKQELNAFAEGRLASITSVAYGLTDGMLNAECNGGAWPAGVRTRSGKLWFPTQNGVAIVDPNTIRINPQPPPVVIESFLIDRAPQPLNGILHIPPGKQNIEIAYTALSFVHSDQIRFQYQLSGLDTNWVDAGSRRTAYYSHVPPGSYRFKVIARNADGVWNTVGQTIEIQVLAPFYMTRWFIVIEILAVAAVIILVVRYRLSQLRRAQARQKAFSQQLIASQEIERQRIAADLHDSLGQRLVVINNLALFSMRANRKTAGDCDDTMKEISSETTLAIQETREISYNLRPFQLDRLGLTKAIEGLARTATKASGVKVSTALDNIDDAFPEELRINFYRIVQESMNNMMKHAEATEAEIRLVRGEKQIVLTIRDNGIGLAPSSDVAKSGKTGFGLTGMAERASTLGGTFRVSSKPGLGTVVTIEILMGDASHV